MGSGRCRSLLPLQLLLPAVCGYCGPLPTLTRAEPPEDIAHQKSFPVGSKVTYRCVQDFVKIPSQTDTIQCLENSLWSSLQEFCDRSCSSPPVVNFAKLSEEDGRKNFYAVGITVNYVCSSGYENSTDRLPTSTCHENLTWSEVPELCQKQSCGPPANPEHGTVVATNHLFGARAEVVCDEGYTLTAKAPFILCFLRGNGVAWTRLPTCQASPTPAGTTAETNSTEQAEEKPSENHYILPLILVPSIIGPAGIVAWSIRKWCVKQQGSYKPNPGDEEQQPCQEGHKTNPSEGTVTADS